MTFLLRWRGAQANNTNMQMWKSVRKGHNLGIGETFAELTFVEKNTSLNPISCLSICPDKYCLGRAVRSFFATKPNHAALQHPCWKYPGRRVDGNGRRNLHVEHWNTFFFCLSRSLSKRNCLKQIVYSKKMEQHSEEWILLVNIFLLRAKLHTKTYNKNSELIYDIKNLPAAGAYFLKSYVSHS